MCNLSLRAKAREMGPIKESKLQLICLCTRLLAVENVSPCHSNNKASA